MEDGEKTGTHSGLVSNMSPKIQAGGDFWLAVGFAFGGLHLLFEACLRNYPRGMTSGSSGGSVIV